MALRRLGGSPPGKTSFTPSGKLGGKVMPYVPRGAQYDYNPPSVFARYKVLTAVFVVLLVSLFGYWAFVLRAPHAAGAAQKPGAPQSDPVYIEPLAPK
jgi:hypothetical protein